MALSIDWNTKVITVPKADLTLVQSSPIEIRELDLNAFRLELKSIEDSAEGMPFLDTHQHNTTVDIGGVTLARVVEIINGYTVTFEDGSYAVNLTGANSNVGDVLNLNSVQVRSANSAGLVQTSEIEFAAFEGAVHVDPNATTTGTLYPAGTHEVPVNNLSDALVIANFRGLSQFVIHDDMTINSGDNYDNKVFIGDIKSVKITIASPASVVGCTFRNATIDGTLDGNSQIENCIIDTLSFVNGFIDNCGLRGTITLGGNSPASVVNCHDVAAGLATPTIDMGGSGQALVVRNYNGGLELTNKTGSDDCSLEVDPGRVIMGNTVGGSATILLRGVGKFVDNGTTATVDTAELLSNASIAQASKSGM